MTPPTHLFVRGAAIAAALLIPLLTLLPHRQSAEATAVLDVVSQPVSTSDLASLPPLFGGDVSSRVRDLEETDRPKLVGVAGSFPGDAVALVRLPRGATRTIKIGDPIANWRLTTLDPDRATFARGGEHYESVLEPVE